MTTLHHRAMYSGSGVPYPELWVKDCPECFTEATSIVCEACGHELTPTPPTNDQDWEEFK